jgi:putative transposase
VKAAGRWWYVDRAIDLAGQVIDVFAWSRRDSACARRCFQRALGTTKTTPREVTSDLALSYPMVLEELLPSAWHCTDRSANNRIEVDHVVSRRGCGRCAGSSRTAAPG